MAVCPDCGAPIRYVRTQGGRKLPINPVPDKRIVVRIGNGLQEIGVTRETFSSHLGTCPALPRAKGEKRRTEGAAHGGNLR